jgi:hypothetical protein
MTPLRAIACARLCVARAFGETEPKRINRCTEIPNFEVCAAAHRRPASAPTTRLARTLSSPYVVARTPTMRSFSNSKSLTSDNGHQPFCYFSPPQRASLAALFGPSANIPPLRRHSLSSPMQPSIYTCHRALGRKALRRSKIASILGAHAFDHFESLSHASFF